MDLTSDTKVPFPFTVYNIPSSSKFSYAVITEFLLTPGNLESSLVAGSFPSETRRLLVIMLFI